MSKDCIISIDMGGTKILAAAMNSKHGVFSRFKKATEVGKNQDAYVDDLVNVIEKITQKAKLPETDIKAIALGVPGSVNPFTGRIGLAPNLGMENFFLKDKLQERVSFPVLLENDVNLAALGIQKFELAKEDKNVLVCFIGTGIGGALIFNGKIYRGSSYTAGEIGHIVVEENGPLCSCGNRGCFEAVASRTAIARNILEDIKSGERSVVKKIISPGQKIKSKALASAISKEDKVVIKRISDACSTIGTTLASIVNLLNLDKIVLGGGVLEALDYFMMPMIKESFKRHALKDSAKGVKIISTRLGDDAALFGGIALAEEFLDVKV